MSPARRIPTAPSARIPSPRIVPARALLACALLAAALCCALGARQLTRALDDPDRRYAAAHRQALADGTRGIARLGTLDRGTPDQGTPDRRTPVPADWLDATAGELHDSLGRLPGLQGQPAARSTVTSAAVTDLDVRAGTAHLIAVLRVDLRTADTPQSGTPQSGTPQSGTERRRVEATLRRTGGGWKITELVTVPTGEGTP